MLFNDLRVLYSENVAEKATKHLLTKEGVGSLAAEISVFGLFNEQLRRFWKLTVKVVMVGGTASALLDVALSYVITAILGLITAQAAWTTYAFPVLCLFGVLGFGGFLSPRRQALRRELQNQGHEGLICRVEEFIALIPGLSRRVDRSTFTSEVDEFLGIWERYTYAIFDQAVQFVVGLISLVTVLGIKAPLAIAPVLISITGTAWLIRHTGGIMGSAWSEYKRREAEEMAIVSDQAASSSMLWMLVLLAKVRHEATDERMKAMREYIKPMERYQRFLFVIGNSFRLCSILTGIVVGVWLRLPPDVATFVIVSGMMMTERMSSVFSIYDFIKSGIPQAEALVDRLRQAKSPLTAVTPQNGLLELEDVTILRTSMNKETKKVITKLVKLAPRLYFRPGITVVVGEKGAGKSTGGEAVFGVHPLKDGIIRFGGYDLSEHSLSLYMFTSQQSFTMEDWDRSPKFLFGGDDAEPLLRKMALWCVGYPDADLDLPIKDHSGGERQSLRTAAAIYAALQKWGEYRFLFLDEPTNHLDPRSIELFVQGMEWLQRWDPRLTVWINSHHEKVLALVDNPLEFSKQPRVDE